MPQSVSHPPLPYVIYLSIKSPLSQDEAPFTWDPGEDVQKHFPSNFTTVWQRRETFSTDEDMKYSGTVFEFPFPILSLSIHRIPEQCSEVHVYVCVLGVASLTF